MFIWNEVETFVLINVNLQRALFTLTAYYYFYLSIFLFILFLSVFIVYLNLALTTMESDLLLFAVGVCLL